jgi:hypothetical protein
MRRLVPGAAVLLSLLLAGCFGSGSNPVKPKASGPVSYPVPSTPQKALTALRMAYQERDSVEYRKMLWFPGYQGTSYDTSQTGTRMAGTFTWSDEVNSIQHFAQDSQVTAVSLDFGLEAQWARTDPMDPNAEPGSAEIVIHSPKLEIDYTDPSKDMGIGYSETMIFRFAPSTPASESPTDTLWTVSAWYEDGPTP